MFGRAKKSSEPALRLRCSFCNKTQDHVRKLVAGPTVNICDECVDVCVDIIATDRRVNGDAVSGDAVVLSKPAVKPWPASDAWCAFCGKVAALETAFLIENRTLLCDPCVQAIAVAATEGRKEQKADE